MFSKKSIGVWLFFMGAVLCGSVAGAFFALTHDLPQIRSLENYRPSAVSRIYSSDNVLLSELYVEKRDPVDFEKIPPELKKALLAAEDRSFYRHSGVDVKGILRAIVKNVLAGEFVQGASTLTQQLAKTLFLTPEKTLSRKLKEAILSIQLERRYTKDEILNMYLNQVYFGSGAYGVQSASEVFFGKDLSQLTLAECALIAAMPKSPSRYSPLVNPELALKRRNIVLRQLRGLGKISLREYETARDEPLKTVEKESGKNRKAPYFTDFVREELEEELGSTTLYGLGVDIRSTVSITLQKAAESAVEKGLNALRNRMESKGLDTTGLQGALVALDVHTGNILAMAGGEDYAKSSYNRAVHAVRQPGSAFKPVIYACAVEKGYSQDMILLDEPMVYRGADKGSEWRPANFSDSYQGKMTMRKALTHSKNIPAVRLLEKLGPSEAIAFARELGIVSPMSPDLSLALGTSEVSLLELTRAYAVFPNMGKYIEPRGVLEVRDRQGLVILKVKNRTRAAMSRRAAAIMVNMLEGVVEEGTGRKAKVLGRPVGGKTGTTNNCKDALFIGFSPSVAAGVWVGKDVPGTMGKGETGASAALPIWIDFMKEALKAKPFDYFDIPDDVEKAGMDPATGERVSENAPGAVPAFFEKSGER